MTLTDLPSAQIASPSCHPIAARVTPATGTLHRVRTLGILVSIAAAPAAWADEPPAPAPGAVIEPEPGSVTGPDPEPGAVTGPDPGSATEPGSVTDPEPVAVIEPGAESAAAADDEVDLAAGGYLQPQFRLRQDDPVAPADENGFRVRRARVTGHATRRFGDVEVSADLEAEVTPDFQLLDAYVTARGPTLGKGRWRLDAGQVKAPVSRQTLLSDSRLAFVEKPELAGLAPDRQIGALATFDPPFVPYVRLAAGVWNGEGRNQGGNVDEHFLYAGRLEVRPLGRVAPLAESAHDGDDVVAALSIARQRLDAGDGLEDVTTAGGDLGFAFRGLSGGVEYLQVTHAFVDQARPNYRANGIAAQLSYLFQQAPVRDHLELGFRWEEIDRNDKVPIVRRGDPNQSLRYFTGALNWYQRAHALKLQLSYSHIVEVEDRDAMGGDATYANDTLLVQATYRID